MPGVNSEVVRTRISMTAVLRLLDFQPCSRRGDQLRGPCPVHGSSNPRSRWFSVNLRLGRYHCFGCGSRGNALELWSAVRGGGAEHRYQTIRCLARGVYPSLGQC